MFKKITKKLFLYVLLIALVPAISYSQPTEEEILASIELGVPWLVSQQNVDGSWGTFIPPSTRSERVAYTGFALTKLCDYANENGFSPFEDDFLYHQDVIDGFNFIFSMLQTHGTDINNLDGKGLYAFEGVDHHHETYNAAIALMAVAASKSPTELVTVGMANGWTFKQVQDEMVAYFEWNQLQHADGGYSYEPTYNPSDNSHTGYVTLALAYAESEGSTIPASLKTNLSDWLDYIQNDLSGGSGYMNPDQWVNLLKTGNLLTEMAFVGNALLDSRVQDALEFIQTNWSTAVIPSIYEFGIGDPQTMYCLMKGFESFDIETISVTGPDDTNWFEVFASDLVATQNPAGYWGAEASSWDNDFLNTCWALFVLEKIVPNKPPVAICQNVEVPADENCLGHATDLDFDGGSYDPDEDPVTIEISPEGPYPLGETIVTLTITDDSGEADECLATITVVDKIPPIPDVDLLPDVAGECEAYVEVVPTASDNCAGIINGTTTDPLIYTEQGMYTITWTYDDGNGNVVTQEQTVIVDDVTPPVIETILEPIVLWPPNHKYVHFELADFVTGVSDNCTELTIGDVKIVKITSDEPEDLYGNGDGKTFEDMVIAEDCMSLDLRSEREGTYNGRVYTIHLELDDGNDNIGTAVCMVNVPHDNISVAIDDGPVYEVLGNCSMEKSGIIADVSAEVEGYALTNYPNPFSGLTTIQFTIPTETKVLLKIYNIFGQEIETLINQRHMPGTHIVKYDASGLPNGYYLYKLKTTDYCITKKMILR